MMAKGKILRTTGIAIIFQPEDKKRNRIAVIHRSLEQRITRYLKGNRDEDNLFRHFDKDILFRHFDKDILNFILIILILTTIFLLVTLLPDPLHTINSFL